MRLFRASASLKFRIVLACVVAGLGAALGAGLAVHRVAQAELQQQILNNDRNERERTASLLGSKLEVLRASLRAATALIGPDELRDPVAMGAFLATQAGVGALYDSLLAVRADGTMVAHTEGGRPAGSLPAIGDREYFKRAMRGDQPVVSQPLISRVTQVPIIVVAAPVLGHDGAAVGVVAGSLRLQSNSLFTDSVASRENDSRDLVIDRAGTILTHRDPRRILGHAADEPGLGAAFSRWQGDGSPIDTRGTAELSQGHVVSMAGIPLSDWMLVRVTPSASALAPMDSARRTAVTAALVAALISALLAGLAAWVIARPITVLRDRAERMVAEGNDSTQAWPQHGGEVGAMSRAFQVLLSSRAGQRAQLQAVMDNAEVGLALTRDGRFEVVSRRFCETFGYGQDKVVGQSTRVIYESEQAYDAFSQRAHPSFMAHGCFDGEVQLKRADGSLFWSRMRGRAVVPGDRSQGTIWVITDATAERDDRDRLSWAASHDGLTGLMNRAGFEALLETAVGNSTTAPFCALFIDLDRFKAVNDTGGHAAGDALLRDIGQALSARVRKSDTVARLGGDEFAVLLPNCPLPQAQRLADALRATVEAYRLAWEGSSFSVGASIGVVAVNGAHADAAEVLRAADLACYEAKRGGRNRVALAV